MIITAILTSLSTIFLMTVEFDEAWILASTLRLVAPSAPPDVTTVYTTGGAYTLLLTPLAAIGIPIHLAGRLLSFLALLAIASMTYRLSAHWSQTTKSRLIIVAMIFAAPGTMILSGMAYGIVPATLLFLAAVHLWLMLPADDHRRWVGVGLLFGAAIATRVTFLPVLPLFVIWSLLSRERITTHLRSAIFASIIALLFFAILLVLQSYLANITTEANNVAVNLSSTGATSDLPRPTRLVSFIVKGTLLIPIPLAACCLFITVDRHFTGTDNKSLSESYVQLLALAALAIIAFWILRSPFQHLRYIWPAILFFHLIGGVYLAELTNWLDHSKFNWRWKMAGALIPIAIAAGTFPASARLITLGAAMQTNTAGQSHLEHHFKAFRLIQEQNNMVSYLKTQIREEEEILELGLSGEWSAMQLSLLSGRSIHRPDAWVTDTVSPTVIITHAFSNLSTEGQLWVEEHGERIAQIGGYSIFRFEKPISFPDIELTLPEQKYRFGFPRGQSLSGK